MKKSKKVITQGFSNLTKTEKLELKRILKKAKVDFQEVDEGEEIVLLKISATGLIPDLIKNLAGLGIELINLE